MLLVLMLLVLMQPNIEVGQNLTPPAQVAGPWEGLVAPGEVAGFSLEIITSPNEKVRSLILDTYVRKEGKTTRTWWSSGDPGAFIMRSGRLQFHQTHSGSAGFDVTVDLTYDSNGMAWKGGFSDPFFSGHVVLRRPRLNDAMAPTGTWRMYAQTAISRTGRSDEYGCLNIGAGQDDTLVLWTEEHNSSVADTYGVLYDDPHATRYVDQWSFMFENALTGERITGVMSSDRSSFGGYSSDHYGNGEADPSHSRRAFAWTRMLQFSCRP